MSHVLDHRVRKTREWVGGFHYHFRHTRLGWGNLMYSCTTDWKYPQNPDLEVQLPFKQTINRVLEKKCFPPQLMLLLLLFFHTSMVHIIKQIQLLSYLFPMKHLIAVMALLCITFKRLWCLGGRRFSWHQWVASWNPPLSLSLSFGKTLHPPWRQVVVRGLGGTDCMVALLLSL